jgi:type VI secretion system secreted protein VgrG
MLENATQSTRQMAVTTPFPEDLLLLRRFSGTEELSRLFEYEVEMVSEDDSIDPTKIVGENISWMLNHSGEAVRYWNANVSCFRYVGQNYAGTIYRATVVPWLWFLTQTTDCRIFQNKTTAEIIETVFTDLGFRDFEFHLRGSYEKREYCVQYRESDFNFVSRLMEEEGIFYYFEHHHGKHTLVVADDVSSYFKLSDYDVDMADPDHQGDLVDQITSWEHETRFRSGRWTQTDFNFKKPRNRLMSTAETVMPVPLAKKFEIYEYPGCFSERKPGSNLTRIRMQENEADYDVVFGECLYRSFSPGGQFRIRSHQKSAEVGREYVVRKVTVEASLAGSYDVNLTTAEDLHFRCRFDCLPSNVVFRPARLTRKPVVEGPQTAIITGPPGEEIYPDEFGRVKAQFHWDREGRFDEKSSCWLRVSQIHAGQRWGSMDLPRVNEEVIVSFLEGDPDRPIITGRVYNGENMPPFSLPAGKTRRGNTTKTYKGTGYNEMSMDDTPGKEQLRMNAQYNMNSNVNNDQTLNVGNNQSEVVGVNRTRKVGSNETVDVGADQQITISANQMLQVGANQTVAVGSKIMIDAGTSITLKCGASMIHMNQAGVITISGTLISVAAAINANVAAPITNISGAMLLTQTGMVNLTAGVVTRMDAAATAVVNSGGKAAMTAGGESIVQGAVVKLN